MYLNGTYCFLDINKNEAQEEVTGQFLTHNPVLI